MSEQEIEKQIQDKNLNAPRLTPTLIDETIVDCDFHVFEKTCLTVCCLTLKNGFTVTGESACASPENFNAEIGQKIARENARNKIWALEGYLLKQRLYETPKTFVERLGIEQSELREKLDKLDSFMGTGAFKNLPITQQELMSQQSDCMLSYLSVLEHRISIM